MTTIAEKVDHVRSKLKLKRFRFHPCHWPGCPQQVHPARWGCLPHWRKLPKRLRDALWAAYRPGQEADRRPSRQYVEVAREIQDWIQEQNQAKLTEPTARRKGLGKSKKRR